MKLLGVVPETESVLESVLESVPESDPGSVFTWLGRAWSKALQSSKVSSDHTGLHTYYIYPP